jgi:hypothetical protein
MGLVGGGKHRGDVDTASVASCQDDLWMPEECVEWIAGKYELVRLSERG